MSTAQHQVCNKGFIRQVSCETPLNAVGVVLTNMKILFPERTKLYKISFISSSRGYLKVRPRFVGAVGKRTITKRALSLSLWCIASRVAARRWDETEAGLLRRESCAGTGGSGGDVQHSRGWNHQSVHTVLREEQVSQSFLIFIRTSCENCSCWMGRWWKVAAETGVKTMRDAAVRSRPGRAMK